MGAVAGACRRRPQAASLVIRKNSFATRPAGRIVEFLERMRIVRKRTAARHRERALSARVGTARAIGRLPRCAETFVAAPRAARCLHARSLSNAPQRAVLRQQRPPVPLSTAKAQLWCARLHVRSRALPLLRTISPALSNDRIPRCQTERSELLQGQHVIVQR